MSLLALLFSVQAFAFSPIQVQVDQSVPHGHDQLGVGSRLTMKVGSSKTVNGIFLGKVIDPSGTVNKIMLLDETNSKVYFANQENVSIGKYSFQTILKPYDQIGGTCTGYAIDHYFQQLYWSGDEGNGEVKTEISTEKGRTQLLVDSINEYYMVLQHHYSLEGVMSKFGTRFGYNCKKKQFADADSAVMFLQSQLKNGLPVMISFLVGPNMVDAPVTMSDYETKSQIDIRLWIPRKKGERASGGHSVVAASVFDFNGRPFMLMLDSDWAEPRLWDMKNYFTSKTAMDEVEFISCQ